MKPLMMMAAIATSTLLLVPTVAQAETGAAFVPISATVTYADLDLGKEADRAALDRRIARSISKLCAEREMRGGDRFRMEALCINAATRGSTATQLALDVRSHDALRG